MGWHRFKGPLVGETFGWWTVVGESIKGTDARYSTPCRCECGTEKLLSLTSLRRGDTRSCGCHQQELINRHRVKHGECRTPLYGIWSTMKRRCESKRSIAYAFYGARGISVCRQWSESYEAFRDWAMVNGYQSGLGLELDRIDNGGDYEPTNCRWVTSKVNNRNKRNNRLLEAFRETKTMVEWSEDLRCVVSYDVLRQRIDALGWNPEKALTAPSRTLRSRKNQLSAP